MKSLAILVLLFASTAFAQDLPVPVERKTLNRDFLIEASTVVTAWTADTVTTAQVFNRCPSCYEAGWIGTGTREEAKPAVAWAALDVACILGAYEWKQHVHNKWLHPFWHVLLLQRTAAHGEAAIQNSQLR